MTTGRAASCGGAACTSDSTLAAGLCVVIVGLIVIAGLIVVTVPLAAQPPALERRIADYRRELPFVESARAFVVDAARRGDSATVRAAMRLVDERRVDEREPWLSPYERLAIAVILPAADIVEDSIALGRLLAADQAAPDARPFLDEHAETLRDFVRENAQRIAARYDDLDPTEESRRFFNLLLNHLHLRGLRGRSELASRAESFALAYPASWRTTLLRRHVIGEYREDRFGLAFGAGYRSANVLGDAAAKLDYAHGASIAGEAYYDELTVVLELLVGIVNAPAPFDAGGESWPSGDLPMIAGSAVAGYELRLARWSLTPLAGLAMHSFRSERGDAGEEPLRTGFRAGFDLGAMIGYRVPFDVGTHIDLRLRPGVSFMSMSGYDDRLSGTLLYLQAGFALVYRPYRPRAG